MNKTKLAWTQARIGLGRSGGSLPTEHHLDLLEAQALAKDSLWRVWDHKQLATWLADLGWPCFIVTTEAHDRQQYLMRPDLGRQLLPASKAGLRSWALDPSLAMNPELVFCISDGLATDAIQKHMAGLLGLLLPRLMQEPFFNGKPYPFVLAPLARVAIADAIGETLGSRLSIICVGERPGLSAHDSLGIYLTFGPKVGLLDNRRNCISNIRPPNGLSYEVAVEQLLFLIRESLRLGLSGVGLKLDHKSELVP